MRWNRRGDILIDHLSNLQGWVSSPKERNNRPIDPEWIKGINRLSKLDSRFIESGWISQGEFRSGSAKKPFAKRFGGSGSCADHVGVCVPSEYTSPQPGKLLSVVAWSFVLFLALCLQQPPPPLFCLRFCCSWPAVVLC